MNSGHSDIRQIYVTDVKFYLGVTDPNNVCEKIPFLQGNTNIKVGEKRKLYLSVEKEILDFAETEQDWYSDNSDKLMPHLEMKLHLVTTEGMDYLEKLVCASGWNDSMQLSGSTIERILSVTNIQVEEME